MLKINIHWIERKHDEFPEWVVYLGIFGSIRIVREYIEEDDREYWYNYMYHDRYGNEQEYFSGGASTLEKCKERIEFEISKNLENILI